MRSELGADAAEPNILAAIWSRRLLVLGFALAFAGIGYLVSWMRPAEYAAEAGVLLADPRPTASDFARDEARYVADQVAIMKSVPVLERASLLAREAEDSNVFAPRGLQRKTSIRATEESNFVVISVRAKDPGAAAAGANAIARAYRDMTRAELEADATEKLRRLDAAIAAAAQEVSSGEEQSSEEDAAALLSRLKSERARLQSDVALTGDGVAVFYPAGRGKSEGASTLSILVLSTVLGGLAGAGAAYWRGARKWAFSDPHEPQGILGAPLLAEIPDFSNAKSGSRLPVISSFQTRADNEFRFLASSLMLRDASGRRGSGRDSARNGHTWATRGAPASRSTAGAGRFIAFVSASPSNGTTILAANTAFAAAQEGQRVLAIDADIESEDLTRLLRGGDPGWAEVGNGTGPGEGAEAESSPPNTQWVMGTPSGGTVSLLAIGPANSGAQHVVRAVDSVRTQFDLMLADVPPVLHVASANALLLTAEAVVVVVSHRSEVAQLRKALDRLDLLGIRPVGYVYNFRPARRKRRVEPSRPRDFGLRSAAPTAIPLKRMVGLARLGKRR